MKIKVFGWILMFDRLNTKDLLVRRHWRSPTEDNSYVMCHSHALEDRLHLFFSCNFSCRVWNYLQTTWGALDPCIPVYNRPKIQLVSPSSWKSCILPLGVSG